MIESAGCAALRLFASLVESHPEAPAVIERRDSSILVTPTVPDGFAVTVFDEGAEAMVAAEGWHAHYDDPEQAAFCAMWLLTPFYRVVHELRLGILAAVWIERYETSGWVGMEAVYYLNPQHPNEWRHGSWRRRYTQQSVLPSPADYDLFAPGVQLRPDGLPVDFHPGNRFEESTSPRALDID
jgi:hypothetical protein